MKVMAPSNIAIIGAGIGGLATASALNRAGHHVQVFERAPQITPVGSGLTLWPNATRVLQNLGVLDQCLMKSSPLDLLEVKLANGRKIMEIPTEKFDTPAIAMHRADLHRALMSTLTPDMVHVDFSCQTIREDQNGVYLCFPEGDIGPFDVLIGADGLRSMVRRYVNDNLRLSYKGYVIWRGVADVGDLVPQDGCFSETWGYGQRFGILPIGDGKVCWYATLNVKQGLLPSQTERKKMIEGLFAGWHKPIEEIIACTNEETIIQTETLDRSQPKHWSRGRTVLIGDAIHPIAANLGQGSCLALEDSIVLTEAINNHRTHTEAFQAYEKIRRPRVSNIQRRSSIIGSIGQWQTPVLTPLRNFVCSFIPGTLFTRTSRSLHAYRAEAQIIEPLRSGVRV